MNNKKRINEIMNFERVMYINENDNYEAKCHVCGKPLSAHKSKIEGIGPKCANNRFYKSITKNMADYDQQILDFQNSFEEFDEDVFDAIDEFIEKVNNAKVRFLNKIVVHANAKIAKGNKQYKELKKVTLNFASMMLNNMWDLPEEEFENDEIITLAKAVQAQDNKILKFKVPKNGNY